MSRKFLSSYTKEFKCIVAGKDEFHALCIYCDQQLDLTSIGKPSITKHISTEKHAKNAKATVENQAMTQFFKPKRTSEEDKIAAAEGSWSYHIVKHGQAFQSADCTSSKGLFQQMFPDSNVAKEFSCARTKTAKIITNILAPHSVEEVLKELADRPFSISIDASNHGESKMFPVVIRYFVPKFGIRVRLLDFAVLPGESSEIVYNFIVEVLQKHGLSIDNLSSFCADNAPVNFGGPQLNGKNNVFHRLKTDQKLLIPIGCPAHILHNAAKEATEQLSFDIESIAFKIQSHFKGSTKRHEALKEFFENAEECYSKFPFHGPTRWLTLNPFIEKLIKQWNVLKMYFANLDKPPKVLKSFFESDETLTILQFLNSSLTLFQMPILFLEKKTALLPQMFEIIEHFRNQIRDRKDRKFYGAKTTASLKLLDVQKSEELKRNFDEFYFTVLQYILKWYKFEQLPTSLKWTLLNGEVIEYDDVVILANQIAPTVAEDDSLFNEVSALNRIIQQTPNEQLVNEASEEKWKKIFANQNFPCLLQLIGIIFSVPASNSFVETIFSLAKLQWTDSRNSLLPTTVKALLQIKINFDFNCNEMHSYLLNNNELLNEIQSNEKYIS